MEPKFDELNNASPQPPPYSSVQTSAPPVNNQSNQQQQRSTRDVETGRVNDGNWGDMSGLSNKNVRLRFIRKVYLIVTSQLIFTFGICSIFVFVEPVKAFAQTKAGLAIYIVSYVVFVTLLIVFTCCSCGGALRKVPCNFILLGLLTLAMTYMLSMISAYHRIEAVFIAVGVTLVITIGVTIFAIQTKFDFTSTICSLIILCLSLAFLGFGLACLIVSLFTKIPILQAVYGGLGACLMAIFLAVDTQMLMGNKRLKFSEEDYVNAALQIYLDICQMFLYILQAVGSNK